LYYDNITDDYAIDGGETAVCRHCILKGENKSRHDIELYKREILIGDKGWASIHKDREYYECE